MEFHVYLIRKDALREPATYGPCLIAVVQADDGGEACFLASRRVFVPKDCFLSADKSSDVQEAEDAIDRVVQVID